MPADKTRYNLTFTAGAAMLSEMHDVAEIFLECAGDWDRTKDRVFRENIMQKDKASSIRRYFALMKQRLEALNQAELEVLVGSTVAVRRQLVLLAICKAHPFICDFIAENVRDCFYNQYEKVTHADFNEFYNEKKYEHPELEQVSEGTAYKMRQVTFRILEQTELIEDTASGILRRPYLSEAMERLIVQDNPKWLAVYLYSDSEISNLRDLYVQPTRP